MFKLEKVKFKNKNDRWAKKYFFGGVWCFVLNESEATKTVLKPTDESLTYFHLLNIEKEGNVIPICGPISLLELSENFDFEKK